jgi:hypothetical protein
VEKLLPLTLRESGISVDGNFVTVYKNKRAPSPGRLRTKRGATAHRHRGKVI